MRRQLVVAAMQAGAMHFHRPRKPVGECGRVSVFVCTFIYINQERVAGLFVSLPTLCCSGV